MASSSTTQAGGTKFDEEKIRWDLLPWEVMRELAKLLTVGAFKYDAHNWREGFDYSRPFAAAMRHFYAWWAGEKYDPDTKCHHLASVIFCFSVILSQELRDDLEESDDLTAENLGIILLGEKDG